MSHGRFEVGQKAFIEKAGKLLVVFRPNGWLDFPGGRIDEGEADLIESLQREVREEMNLVIEVGDPFTTWLGRESSVYLVGYRCRYVSGDVRLSEEHSAFDWIDYAGHFELDDGSAPFRALRKYFHGAEKPAETRDWSPA